MTNENNKIEKANIVIQNGTYTAVFFKLGRSTSGMQQSSLENAERDIRDSGYDGIIDVCDRDNGSWSTMTNENNSLDNLMDGDIMMRCGENTSIVDAAFEKSDKAVSSAKKALEDMPANTCASCDCPVSGVEFTCSDCKAELRRMIGKPVEVKQTVEFEAVEKVMVKMSDILDRFELVLNNGEVFQFESDYDDAKDCMDSLKKLVENGCDPCNYGVKGE